MTLKFALKYLKDCHNKLKDLSKKGVGNICYLWYDFIVCSIAHGAIVNHYTRGQLYKVKGCERRKSMTYGRILKSFSKMNHPDSIKILNNKHLFNAHFAPFVKRKWLYSKDMTIEAFSELCRSCSSLMVKPEDGLEGNGISKITPPIYNMM